MIYGVSALPDSLLGQRMPTHDRMRLSAVSSNSHVANAYAEVANCPRVSISVRSEWSSLVNEHCGLWVARLSSVRVAR